MSGEIATALKKQGIKITPKHVANIKTKINKARTAKKAAKRKVPEPAPVEKAAYTVTVEQVRAVTQMIKVIGGFDRLNELLGLVREVGGLRRFKDLLDAMQ